MRKIFIFVSLLFPALMAGADDAISSETVTVGDTKLSKFVNMLSFSGDQVTLTFDDNTTQTSDKSQLSIDISYMAVPTGINGILPDDKQSDSKRVFNLSGQYVGANPQQLAPGVYISNGKKIIVK